MPEPYDRHGHVKISRKAFLPLAAGGDPFWNKKRVFSEWEAWQYLIKEAAFAPHTRALRHGVVQLQRGETPPLSIRFLMRAWGWGSKKRVESFLDLLEKMERIRVQQRTPDGDTYSIVNIAFYQGWGDSAAPQAGTEAGTPRSQRGATTGDKQEAEEEEKAEEDHPVVGLVEEARELDNEQLASAIVIAANQGMRDNPAIGPAYNPIPTGHGSRQKVLDWLAAGVPADIAASAVYQVARSYQPSERKRQINSMAYFDAVVLAANDRRVAESTPVPDSPEAPLQPRFTDDDLTKIRAYNLAHPKEAWECRQRAAAELERDGKRQGCAGWDGLVLERARRMILEQLSRPQLVA